MSTRTAWTAVLSDVLVWSDSCNVYAILGPEGAVIVDAGTGEWLEGLEDLPVPPVALACTHYFRDHSAGVAAASRAGIPIYVPQGEEAIFRDPAQHFRKRETYLIYDNIWDLFAPVDAVPLAGVLRDYDVVSLAGLAFTVIPLPGATPTQAGLLVRTPQSCRLVAFCGETIHSAGRVPRMAPLQYNYGSLGGAVNVAFSAHTLHHANVDVLLPSLGEPIRDSPQDALADLHSNLIAHAWDRGYEEEALKHVGRDCLEPITPRLWTSTQSVASSYFILGKGHRAVALDYGYWYPGARTVLAQADPSREPPWPAYAYPERRRALLHSLGPLREQVGVRELAAVIPTHYHDDHVCGIPLLQRLMGIQCWAPENFAAMLENPRAHRFPCTWPEPIRVTERLRLDEALEWDDIRFQFGPMSGHTRFSALVGWEVDGVRYAHVGDQYAPFARDSALHSRARPAFWAQYVYSNGAFLDSYRASAAWLGNFRPDIVVSGHYPAVQTDDSYFELLAEYGERYELCHREAAALGDEEPHFGLAGMCGWMWPYRVHLSEPEAISFRVTVRNPLPTAAMLDLRLRGPDGWTGSAVRARAAGRAEICVPMRLVPQGRCRRQPVVVDLRADGRPFGQVVEALVTIGDTPF